MDTLASTVASLRTSTVLSLTWSQGITEAESRVVQDAIEGVLKWLYLRHPAALREPAIRVHAYGNWVIPALVPDKPYWGTQWYIEHSYDPALKRVIAPSYLELVRQEPWQRVAPHLDLALIEQDLTDLPGPVAKLRPDRYTLGTSFPGSMAVMSAHRLRTLSDAYTRELALARLVRHHLGHVLRVPEVARKGNTERLGLETHCTNVCVMRHVATVDMLATYALEESEMGWPFCDECTRGLHGVIVRHQQSWN